MGDVLQDQATPRILLTFPGSLYWIANSLGFIGQVNTTWPPPSGAAPRRVIYKKKFLVSTES